LKNPVLVGCLAICLLAIVAFLLFGKGDPENRVAATFASAQKAGSAPELIEICRKDTPFQSKDQTYFPRTCLLAAACSIRPTSMKSGVDICRELDSTVLIEGDQNISAQTCIDYIEQNC
jgi:hypothetical protein